MRRMPYIRKIGTVINYVCPKCRQVISRDKYKMYDSCPTCNLMTNKTAKKTMQFYSIYDKDMYNYFIYKYGRK